jgi:hypothetical protein
LINYANLWLGDSKSIVVKQCPNCYAIKFEDFDRDCDVILVEHTLRDIAEFHGGQQKGGVSVWPALTTIILNVNTLFTYKVPTLQLI